MNAEKKDAKICVLLLFQTYRGGPSDHHVRRPNRPPHGVVVGSEIFKKDNPKKKGHDERFTMARIEKGHGFDPPMAFEFS